MAAVQIALQRPLFSAWCLWLRPCKLCRLWELCERLAGLGSSAQGWVHGCEMQVQKYPEHSGMCRKNITWNILMESESCQGKKWWEPDFSPVHGSAVAGEDLVPVLQSTVRTACPCRLLPPSSGCYLHLAVGAWLAPLEHEVCRKGHRLAIVALSVFVFVRVTHLSQGHLETRQGRPNYSRWEKKKWQNI